ncbi:hypothetical protein ARMSODRAFT_1011559 [Armillaria solidipes]|uniref:Uncharacterized protein n=1 Tax=Armillaria solidipes TaxID=1076256 RepID=A0A2H3C337_9AGAR|nr:hypothetical protein ARMSODRAFT_1011559 [Armillaria solidipes]
MSSLRFGQDQSQTSTQQDSMFSINLNDDPEAQRVRVSGNDIEAQQEEVKIGHEATPRPIV